MTDNIALCDTSLLPPAIPVTPVACATPFLGPILSWTDPAVRQGYANLFHSSAVVHISTIDIFLLSIFYVDPLREDMQRRGYTPDAAKVALFSVPVIGPAAWLLVRPAVLVNDA